MATPKKLPRRPLLGAHVSVAGGLEKAFERATELGCEAIQIFVSNPNQWRPRALTGDEVERFRAARVASSIGPVVAHASYLINLGATDDGILAMSEQALGGELERCARLGVDALVLHPGSHRGTSEEEGIERAAGALDRVLAGAPEGPLLLLENTAGQGSALGFRLEQLAAIRSRLDSSGPGGAARVGFCLDTCHAFAAGYPIHEAAGYEAFVEEADRRLGLERVHLFHLNDSVKPFGSRRDRHAHIGEGEIGAGCFARLVADRRFVGVGMVIETETGPDREGHRRDLATLRSL
jgi:deoxyribonuclease-4